ncbi:MAG: hypothetical protein A3C13_01410 [Candidatus Lloydbacteria bacterium RIFCSPHIGHO2_02_FULL_50_11]|nr:MAG: hypothetical protein A3C13_01410 [Candidatus Lloydbacteria bacterium RIFCSPHIGHO2_02_FULL_50_11]
MKETLAGDLAFGRLAVSEWGLKGVVGVPWHDIKSMSLINSQTVSLLRAERFFHVPVAKRKVVLHFNTNDDCQQFVQAVKGRLLSISES